MTVWTHDKWTLFRRAHVAWALLHKVLLDGHDLLFFRSNSLPLPPCHLHGRGYPAFWSCSVFSISNRVLVLIYIHVLYLSIHSSSSSSSAALFVILHHWANDVTSIIRKLPETSSLIGRYPYIMCTTSHPFLIQNVRVYRVSVPDWMYVRSGWPTSRTLNSPNNDQGISMIDFAPSCCCLKSEVYSTLLCRI